MSPANSLLLLCIYVYQPVNQSKEKEKRTVEKVWLVRSGSAPYLRNYVDITQPQIFDIFYCTDSLLVTNHSSPML
jgi:hypothetical protein